MRKQAFSDAVLIVVDAQNGFTELCPRELPVPGGTELVGPINRLMQLPWSRIDATQDWHPANHCSFLGQPGNLYPPHCVAGTRGADFLPGLETDRFHTIWRKGYQADFEAYAITAQHPHYADLLHAAGIKRVFVCGIATNICCFFTARDLRLAGFDLFMIEDASTGIDVPAANLFQQQARQDAQALGIRYVPTSQVIGES